MTSICRQTPQSPTTRPNQLVAHPSCSPDWRAIFLTEGFRRVTIGELAARLHCSRRTLYALAPSKEGLFLLVLTRFLNRIVRQGSHALERVPTGPQRIVAFIQPGITESMACTATFFADIASLAPARQLLAEHQDSRQRILGELVAVGVRAGECRDIHSEVAAQAMLAAYRAITSPEFLMGVDVSLQDALREIQDLFLYGLLQR